MVEGRVPLRAPRLGRPRPGAGEPSSRGVVAFVWLAVIGYGWASSHGTMLYGGRAMVGTTAGLLVVFALLLVAGFVPLRPPKGLSTVLVALLPGALLNILATGERLEVLARWTIWFVLLGMSMVLAGASTSQTNTRLRNKLPLMMALFWFALYTKATFFVGEYDLKALRSTWHLSGLYANLTLALGLFAHRGWERYAYVGIGLIGVFLSGSAGAAFGIPISLVPYVFYQLRRKPGQALVASGLVVATAFMVLLETDLGDRFLDRKLGPYADILSGRDRMARSGEGRIELIRQGLEISRNNPLGTGLGPTYGIQIGRVKVLQAHNGFISTLIQAGWMVMAAVGVGLVIVLWRIARAKCIPGEHRVFYFTYVATNFGRSLSEDIGIFDLGNISSVLFLYFTAYFYYQSWKGKPPAGRVPNRTRGALKPSPGIGRIPLRAIRTDGS